MALESFIQVLPGSHFSIQNLPYGAFKTQPTAPARLATAIGDYVLDLSEIAKASLFNGPLLAASDCFLQPTLNNFLALGRPAWKEARVTLQKLLSCSIFLLPIMVEHHLLSSLEQTLIDQGVKAIHLVNLHHILGLH